MEQKHLYILFLLNGMLLLKVLCIELVKHVDEPEIVQGIESLNI